MQLNIRKACSGMALLAAAWTVSVPALAAGGTVSYMCQNNKSVDVKYRFNSAGVPTMAQAVLDGANRVMRYDMGSSDDVDTFMKDRQGYRLSSGYLDINNYQTNSISINAPDGLILFKSCSPKSHLQRAAPRARRAKSQGNSVSYVCQNKRRLNVRYQFNAAGIPTHAIADIHGRSHALAYNQKHSDNVDTVFTGRGYRLSAGYLDSGNFRSEGGLMVTSPDNQLLYKGCNPVR